MLLPVGAAFGPLTRAVELRTIAGGTILARTREARTLVTTAIVAGAVEARFVETARAIAGGVGIAVAAILALLPRL